jgi:hypothetical protein
MIHPSKTIAIIVVTFVFLSFYFESSLARPRIFASFEDESQVSAINATPGVLLFSSNRFPIWGDKSLEVVFPVAGGSIELTEVPVDWLSRNDPSPSRGVPWKDEVLLIFVWSMQPAELALILSDFSGGSWSKTVPLRTGANHLQIQLEQALGVNLKHIRSLTLSSKRESTFYLDYLALDRHHPVLDKLGRWDAEYSMQLETPHVPWGRPFSRGQITVYTIGNARGAGRGIIELAQRLELNFKVTTIHQSGFDFGDFYFHRRGGPSIVNTYIADDLLNGPRYDVILWPDLQPWEFYSAEVRDEIRRRVEAGAGLILFHPSSRTEDGPGLWEISPLKMQRGRRQRGDSSKWRPTKEHYITRGVPLEAFPWGHISASSCEPAGEVLLETEGGTPVLAVRTLGKGRVVAFSYNEMGMIPRVADIWETNLHYPYQEYMWSLVARAVVWASGREPGASIVNLQSTGNKAKISLGGVSADSRLEASLNNSFGEPEGEINIEVAPGSKELTLSLPANLSAGRQFVNLRLISEGLALDWATFVLNKPPKVTISSLTLDADRFEPIAPVSGKLNLISRANPECEVAVRLYDNYNRLVDQQCFETRVQKTKEISFNLDARGALTNPAKIDCEVTVNGLRQDRRTAKIYLQQPPKLWDDYEVIMYSGNNPLPGLWPTVDRKLQRFGVTALCWYPLDLCKNANYRVQTSVRVSGTESPDGAARNYYNAMKKKYAKTRDKKVLIREHCLNDPAYYNLLKKEVRDFVTPWLSLSNLCYFVYEEPSYSCYGDALDICFSEHCMLAMRKWLKEEYGTLEALNAQWGTSFPRWEDVVPEDTYEAQARGNYASWADHRTFNEISLTRSYKFVLDELRKYDPQAIQLLSGTQSGCHSGQDYSRIDPVIGYIDAGASYMHRCFNPEIKLSANGRATSPGKLAFYNIYRELFNGSCNGAFLFWQYSMLNPDYTLNLTSRDIIESLEEMRSEGIGKLVGLSKLDNYGIALHYSYPSVHGSWIVDGTIRERVSYNTSRTYGRFRANKGGWTSILKDAGLQFDHIAYGAVEKGELISKGYKIFIMPMSICLSDEEIAAIREFVEQGGTVIADALPGVMDDHCTFRTNRVLEDVFGVKTVPSDRETIIAMQGEPRIKLRGASALLEREGRPLHLENRYGKGRAYLLNYFLHNYQSDRLQAKAEPTLKKVKKVLSTVGIRPEFRLTSIPGDPVTDCETYVFRLGSTRLLGMIPDKNKSEPQRIRISFDQEAVVYDVRRKRCLGRGTAFDTEIEGGVPRLFALLEKRVGELEAFDPEKAALGDEIRIDFRIPQSDLQSVARVAITDPTGRQLRYYGGNRDIVNGSSSVSFRTALNDPAGIWHVEITEVMSGEKADLYIMIMQ